MGVSTDAILVYGIQLGSPEEGDELPWGEDTDIDAYVLERYGAPKEIEFDEDEESEQYKRWRRRLDERREFEKTIPVEIDTHCSDDYTMYTLIIKESRKRASRGSPEAIDPDDMRRNHEWILDLKEACRKLEIEYEEPRWWLQSYWG
jgi:hypothetical protein